MQCQALPHGMLPGWGLGAKGRALRQESTRLWERHPHTHLPGLHSWDTAHGTPPPVPIMASPLFRGTWDLAAGLLPELRNVPMEMASLRVLLWAPLSCLSHTHSHTHALTHSHIHMLTHTYSHNAHTHSHALTHTYTILTLTCSHTHTILTLTYSHTYTIQTHTGMLTHIGSHAHSHSSAHAHICTLTLTQAHSGSELTLWPFLLLSFDPQR